MGAVPNYIAFAVPFFFILIGVELWVARRRGREVYRFNDALVDLSTGISQQVAVIFYKGLLFAAYTLCYQLRFFELSAKSALTWLFAIVLVDFSYYWWHRLSHEVNFLWAAHVVHHSSEDYNLAVALRQSVLTPLTILPFHLPAALLGVPPLVMLAVDSFNTLYQFWIHTQLVEKMGALERWINTPASHRVHHAINPRYLDKNYGGTFIVWDRLFGTYEAETEAPVYGLVKALRKLDPFTAQFHYWGELWERARSTPRLADKLRVLVKGPPWTPPGMEPFAPPAEVQPATFAKYDPPLAKGLARYLFVQLVLVLIGATSVMFYENTLTLAETAAAGGAIYLTLLTWGGFLERRSWALPVEVARLLLLSMAVLQLVRTGVLPLALAALALAASVAMMVWLLRGAPRAAVSSLS